VLDAADNCRFVYNPDQSDLNNNGIGDACDPTASLPGGAEAALGSVNYGSFKVTVTITYFAFDVNGNGVLEPTLDCYYSLFNPQSVFVSGPHVIRHPHGQPFVITDPDNPGLPGDVVKVCPPGPVVRTAEIDLLQFNPNLLNVGETTLDFAVGQFAKLNTSWMFTDIADSAPADTAFSEPVAGNALVNANNSFWIGNDAYYATDLKVELGGAMSAFAANSGPHGVQGYKVMKAGQSQRTRMTVTLALGPNAGEVNETLLNTLQGYGLAAGAEFVPLDVAFQVGGAAAGFGYNPMCAAVVVACDAGVVVDGRKHVALTLEATDPVNAGVTGGASLYPYEFHLG